MTEPAPTTVRPSRRVPGRRRTSGSSSTAAVDVGVRRVGHRHALAHPAAVDAAAGWPRRPRAGRGRHTERLGRVGRRRGDDEVPGGAQHADHVGQVVLALPVLGLEPPQRRREEPATEAVDRRVHLGDGELGVVGVGLLDDAIDDAVGVADDAPVPRGVVELGGEDRRRGVGEAVLGGQRGEGVGSQQRRVAGEDEDVVFGVEIEAGAGEADAGGVPGPEALVLLDELEGDLGGELLLDGLADPFGAVADDDDDPGERELDEPVEDVEDHRAAAQRVQHLRRLGAHPGALAGGEDHGGDGSVGQLVHPLRI